MQFKKKIVVASGDRCKECKFVDHIANTEHWCRLWDSPLTEDEEYGTYKCSKCMRKVKRVMLKAQEAIDDTY